mmetsp:Transcript_16344/g.40271  ORF Transcript_16344/g.40271 Transcript_16344/m.40271 type:complete len:206 (-) Transcript_16344:12-629(-)
MATAAAPPPPAAAARAAAPKPPPSPPLLGEAAPTAAGGCAAMAPAVVVAASGSANASVPVTAAVVAVDVAETGVLASSIVKFRGPGRPLAMATMRRELLAVAPSGGTTPPAYVHVVMPSSRRTASCGPEPKWNAVQRQRRPAPARAASTRHAPTCLAPIRPESSRIGLFPSGAMTSMILVLSHGRANSSGDSVVHLALSDDATGQ